MYPLFLAVEVRIRLALLTNRISARLTSRHCSAFLNFVYLRLYPLFLAVPWWLLHKEHETLSCNKYLWPNNPTLLLSTLSAGVQIIWYIKAPLCWALYVPTIMELTRFNNSTKDIPIPSETEYKCKFIEKTEQLCKRMRWKAFFFLNPCTDGSRKETFGLYQMMLRFLDLSFYQKALDANGYSYTLHYEKPNLETKDKSRKRNIISVRLICCCLRFSAWGSAYNCSWSWQCSSWRSCRNMIFWELFIKDLEECAPNICSHRQGTSQNCMCCQTSLWICGGDEHQPAHQIQHRRSSP